MKKEKIIYNFCYLKIRPTKSNIFVTLTDFKGQVIIKSSAGIINFSGKKKKTAYVAENVVKKVLLDFKKKNINIKILVIQLSTTQENYGGFPYGNLVFNFTNFL